MKQLAVMVATGFGLGYLPKSPGTYGSLLGIGFGVLLHCLSIPLQIGGIVLATAVGMWCIEITEKLWNEHDSGKIVWDEVIGQAIAILPTDLSAPQIITAFILFRILDIWKPGPIGWADEKLPGAWGTMIDDVIAGIATALAMWGIRLISQ